MAFLGYLASILLDERLARGVCFLPDRDRHSGEMNDMTSFFREIVKVPRQTHSLTVGIVEDESQIFEDVDALITFIPELPIGVFTADCVPLVGHSDKRKILGCLSEKTDSLWHQRVAIERFPEHERQYYLKLKLS